MQRPSRFSGALASCCLRTRGHDALNKGSRLSCSNQTDGQVDSESLVTVDGIAAVACSADRGVLGAMREALARRPDSILPLITEPAAAERYVLERHVCVDTTAAGGNASLLARAEA